MARAAWGMFVAGTVVGMVGASLPALMARGEPPAPAPAAPPSATPSPNPAGSPAPAPPGMIQMQSEAVTEGEVPQAVKGAVAGLGDEVALVEARRQRLDGVVLYDLLAATRAGMDRVYVISGGGQVLRVDEEGAQFQAPPELMASVARRFPGSKIVRSGKTVETGYWVYFMNGDAPGAASLDSAGGVVFDDAPGPLEAPPPAEPGDSHPTGARSPSEAPLPAKGQP